MASGNAANWGSLFIATSRALGVDAIGRDADHYAASASPMLQMAGTSLMSAVKMPELKDVTKNLTSFSKPSRDCVVFGLIVVLQHKKRHLSKHLPSMRSSVLLAALSATGTCSALNILLGNDDGFGSAQLRQLKDILDADGHKTVVVAPVDNESGQAGRSSYSSSRKLTTASKFNLVPAGSPALGRDPVDQNVSTPKIMCSCDKKLCSGTLDHVPTSRHRTPSAVQDAVSPPLLVYPMKVLT